MKKGIHPSYHNITIVTVNGNKMNTISTWGKEGDVVHLNADPTNHQAWVKSRSAGMDAKGKASVFRDRYGDISGAFEDDASESEAEGDSSDVDANKD